MLGVGAVAVRELLGLPAPGDNDMDIVNLVMEFPESVPAEHPLVAHVLDVHGVDHLGALHLDRLVHSVGLHPGQHGELLLDDGSHAGGVSEALKSIYEMDE